MAQKTGPQIMHTETLIIGGGLSGLALAHRLQQAGVDYRLVEARGRLGGRIASLRYGATAVDLGPSWVWPGQDRVAQLVSTLGLHLFDQWSAGAQLFEAPDGRVIRDHGFMSMAGSLRITGGTSALTDALAAKLDPARVMTGASVAAIDNQPRATLSDGQRITADRIVLAIPPRLMAQIRFTPVLPQAAMLATIPTWMGAHAKFVALYQKPFWREEGLSGDASSRRGPLVEIHDASPEDGGHGALFGFVGVPAVSRQKNPSALAEAALAQVARLFGPNAAEPLAYRLKDWSAEPFTAALADAAPPPGHPDYHLPQALADLWDGKLILAVTELAPDNGGLIEGALSAAERAAGLVLNR